MQWLCLIQKFCKHTLTGKTTKKKENHVIFSAKMVRRNKTIFIIYHIKSASMLFRFQVLAAVSQLSSLFNGLRTLSHSSSGRPHRKKEPATASDTSGSTEEQQTKSSAEEFFSTQLVRAVVSIVKTVTSVSDHFTSHKLINKFLKPTCITCNCMS